MLDPSTTHVRHAVLCVSFKKYYFSAQTRVRHGLDTRWTQVDMTHIRLEHNLVLFSNYLMDKKRIQRSKNQIYLGILFEVSIEIVPHIFWKRYRKYT